MDDDLRQKFAPRRNKRYSHLRSFNEEAEWARSLDWRTNDYDFYLLARRIVDHVDSEYREKAGLRVDQFATAEEIQRVFQTCRTRYQEEEELFGRGGIYVFLHLNLDLWLGGKAWDALKRRRQEVEGATA